MYTYMCLYVWVRVYLSCLSLLQDKKSVESVCMCFSRLVDNLNQDEKTLKELAAHEMLTNVLKLVCPSNWSGKLICSSNWSVFQTVHQTVRQTVHQTARQTGLSAKLSVKLSIKLSIKLVCPPKCASPGVFPICTLVHCKQSRL